MPGRPSGAAKEKKQTKAKRSAHACSPRGSAVLAQGMGGECGHEAVPRSIERYVADCTAKMQAKIQAEIRAEISVTMLPAP
jgi:hypothetical protein